MSERSCEQLVQAYFDALNASSWDGLLRLLRDDAIHDTANHVRQIGPSEFRDFLASQAQIRRETIQDIVILTSRDETRAAAEFTARGEMLSHDRAHYSVPGAIFFEVEDGKFARVTEYRGRAS